MLFGTAAFAFAFLPITFALFFVLAKVSNSWAAVWLFLASLYFYAYWMPEFVLLLLISIAVNFGIGSRIARVLTAPVNNARRRKARSWLIAGIVFDLGVLGYFKYANFFLDSLNTVLGTHIDFGRVTLPIGISFYTFTQIAFLADAYQKGLREYKPSHYGLFVTYFPHLIAGPVLHHAQMMPQFGRATTYRLDWANVAAGLAIFGMGLFKKVVLGDGISPYADTVFNAADDGTAPNFSEAWIGALAYTFQLYFDFSGYSDMAIGLSWLFNVRMPYNFDSPYKSANIIDFWRRWHMTLSAFLRDYLYVPLGGNRSGRGRRYLNLMVTMVLGGLWHGANWTFVVWGALHGLYLMINHAYRAILGGRADAIARNGEYRIVAVATTFIAVVVAWVFFRAHTFSGAAEMLRAMSSPASAFAPSEVHPLLWNAGLPPISGWIWCLALAVFAFLSPNSNRFGERILTRCRESFQARFFTLGVSLSVVVLLVLLNESRDSVSPFIYFNF